MTHPNLYSRDMPGEETSELKFWLGFNRVRGIGPAKLSVLLDHFGSLERAWRASEVDLHGCGLDRRAAANLLKVRKQLDLDAELNRVTSSGVKVLIWPSAEYPRYLKEIPNPPPVLFIRGEILESDQWAIAVVGTRRLTVYGRQVTRELVEGLVRHNITVVSGLARGIDAIAHKTALSAGGRTIAVLGSGLDRVYPSEHRNLALKIVDGRGALVTEQALGVAPEARNFPPRNRIISGLSLGVIVIEAGERSGALITANFALDQDREVFAIPGNINSLASKGTNNLIQQGAKLVMSVDDVLEELNLMTVAEHTVVQSMVPESDEEAILLETLSHQPTHIDELIQHVRLPSATVSSTLSLMELKGMVQQVGGMNYVLAREPDPSYSTAEETEQSSSK